MGVILSQPVAEKTCFSFEIKNYNFHVTIAVLFMKFAKRRICYKAYYSDENVGFR
jgi:hypothetical protein